MAVQLTNEMIQGAKDTEKMTGVPASITLAQIIEESSGSYVGGLSGLAYKGNNLFGVKSFKSNENRIYMKDGNGQLQAWRKYNTKYDSIVDHARILSLPRYTKLYQNASTTRDYAEALQKGGYAGNSTTYADKLMTHINTYNLSQYDLNQSSNTYSGNYQSLNDSNENYELNIVGNIIKYSAIVMLAVIGIFFIIKCLGIETDLKKVAINKVAEKIGGDE